MMTGMISLEHAIETREALKAEIDRISVEPLDENPPVDILEQYRAETQRLSRLLDRLNAYNSWVWDIEWHHLSPDEQNDLLFVKRHGTVVLASERYELSSFPLLVAAGLMRHRATDFSINLSAAVALNISISGNEVLRRYQREHHA